MLDRTVKGAYLMDVAIPNSHNPYSTYIEKLQKYTELKEELIRIWQHNAHHVVSLVLSTTSIVPKNYTTDSNCSVFALVCVFLDLHSLKTS
jgi:hypothetical protein